MRHLTIALLIALTVAAFPSCNKDDDHTPLPGIGGSMSATIAGSPWAATETGLYQPAGGLVEFYGTRAATSSSATTVYVHIESFTDTGDYPFNGGLNWASLVKDNIAYVASNGKTTVTLNNDTFFKATFAFDANDTLGGGNTKTVSGSFSYRKQ